MAEPVKVRAGDLIVESDGEMVTITQTGNDAVIYCKLEFFRQAKTALNKALAPKTETPGISPGASAFNLTFNHIVGNVS